MYNIEKNHTILISEPLPSPPHNSPGWYKGDGHVHSEYSETLLEPDIPLILEMVTGAKANGLEWTIFTDHSDYIDSSEWSDARDECDNEDINWSTSDDGVILNCQGATISDSGYAISIPDKSSDVVMNCIINASSGIKISGSGHSHEFLNNVFDIEEKAIFFETETGGSSYIEDNIILNNEKKRNNTKIFLGLTFLFIFNSLFS